MFRFIVNVDSSALAEILLGDISGLVITLCEKKFTNGLFANQNLKAALLPLVEDRPTSRYF